MTKKIKISPGDTLVVQLPQTQPNRKVTCSVKMLDKKPQSKDNFVGQIVDVVMFASKDKRFAPGEIVEIPKKDILSVMPAEVGGQRANLMVGISNGTVVELSRIDGKTEELNVLIIDRDTDSESVFKVDSFAATMLASNMDDLAQEPELFENEQH